MARTRQDALLGLVSQMSGGSRRGTTISQYLKAISKDEETHLVVIVDQNNTPTDFYSAIQPDYAQADEEALDFIKNKPDLTVFYREGEVLENRLTLRKPNGDFLEYEPVIPAAMTYMGSCLQADLPTTGQSNGDYWKLADAEGQYAGQCAIWNSTNNAWDYSSSNLTIETTVQEGSPSAVSGNAVFQHTKENIQTIYDAIYPVRSKVIGLNAPSIPAGVEATWEIDNDYNGKYLYVDSGQAPGTTVTEGAVIGDTAITEEQIPWHQHDMEHYHNKGDMNIQGYFSIAPSMSGRSGDTLPIKKVSGAFYDAGGVPGATHRIEDIDASYTRTTNPQAVGFAAARTGAWTGLTSQARDITNSFNISVTGGVGAGDPHTHTIGHIKPAGVVVNVWKRTA